MNLNCLYNSEQFIQQKGLDYGDCIVIIVTKQKVNLERLRGKLALKPWRAIDHLYLSGLDDIDQYLNNKIKLPSFRYFRAFNKTKLYNESYEYVINSSLSNMYVNTILNCLDYEEYILVDEGSITLRNNRIRRSRYRMPHRSNPFANQNLREILHLYFFHFYTGFRVKRTPSVTFFTSFELDLDSTDKIIPVDNPLKTDIESISVDHDLIVFLGSPQVERGRLTKEVYWTLLRYFIECHGEKQHVYFRHRFEDEEKLKEIEAEFDLEIIASDEHIEYYYLNQNLLPKRIFTTYSSVVPLMSGLFKGKCQFRSIVLDRDSFIDHQDYNAILAIYEQYGLLNAKYNNIDFIDYTDIESQG